MWLEELSASSVAALGDREIFLADSALVFAGDKRRTALRNAFALTLLREGKITDEDVKATMRQAKSEDFRYVSPILESLAQRDAKTSEWTLMVYDEERSGDPAVTEWLLANCGEERLT